MMENYPKKTGKKLIRALLLLLSSVLVVTASASVLNYLYMQASPITAETAKVQFVLADDSEEAGASIGTNGTYVSLNSMAGWPNATRVYQAAVGIKNFDSASRNITLAFASWSGDTSQIEFITVIVRDAVGGTQQGNAINVGIGGSSTGKLSIPADTTWVVEWNIKWKAGALSTNTVSVTLQLLVEGE
ncbi:MAG: hypothetical protein QXH87_03655 [Candidatus Bathyarchaeia archaeon]